MATAPIGGQRPIPRSTPSQGRLGKHKVDRLKSAGLTLQPQRAIYKGKPYAAGRTFSSRGAVATDSWLDRNPNAADPADKTKDVAPRALKDFSKQFSRLHRK